MMRLLRAALAALSLAPAIAAATFHTFVIDQVYSNATGTIQFVVLREASNANGQQFLAGHELTASRGGESRTFEFAGNLPSNATAGRRALIATEGFAALGIVTPDYVIPNGFLFRPGGTVDFAGVDSLTYSVLPDDGVTALDGNGNPRSNVATNFAGVAASVTAQQANPNHTALWWNPAESGWGINLLHQGNILFATLFTYDTNGTVMWLVMSNGALESDGRTYSGTLFRTTGPAFNANPFPPLGPANITAVGNMSVTFNAQDSALLVYTVNGAPVTKTIQRQVFGARPANCVHSTASRAGATNYQDLWWIPAESGWGVNITHQDNILFATLFTYDATGRGLWLVMSNGERQPDGSYSGTLFQTTGPPFNAVPFTPIGPSNITTVGTMQFRATNGENAVLTYTVNNVPVTKQVVRQVFASPVPACS